MAIKATKNEFSLEVAKLYEHFKKERKFKIHSFRLALFATPLCRLNFLHQNTLQKLNSRTKSVFKSTLSHERKRDKFLTLITLVFFSAGALTKVFATQVRNTQTGSGAKVTQKQKAKNFQIFYSHSQTLTRL